MEFGQKVFTRNYLLLLAIVLVGLFLRVYNLGANNLWLDEAIAVYIAKLGLSQFAQAQPAIELNPPLYFVILHYWAILFGDSEFAVRFLSVVFGVLAIPMIYVVGRQLFDEEAGLVGALILALSSFNVQFSQEARMYSLMLLLTLLSMFFFARFLRKSNLSISGGYILVTTLLLYTHVFGLFVVVAQNIYVLALLFLRRENPFPLRRWIAFQAIILALFAPWIRILISHISTVQGGFWVPLPTLGTFLHTFVLYGGNGVLLVIFVALSVCSLFTYTNARGSTDRKGPLKALQDYLRNVHITNTESVMFLVVWLLTVNVIPFVISRFSTPIYLEKYAIAASVAFYLLAAGGLRNINWRYVKLAVVAVIVILSAVNLHQYYTYNTKANAQEPFNVVINNAQSGDVVIVFPGYVKFIFDYYGRGTNANVTPFPAADYYSMSWENKNTAENIKELQSDVNGHDRVWFVSATGHGSAALLIQAKKALDESYDTRSSQSYPGYDVLLYEKRA